MMMLVLCLESTPRYPLILLPLLLFFVSRVWLKNKWKDVLIRQMSGFSCLVLPYSVIELSRLAHWMSDHPWIMMSTSSTRTSQTTYKITQKEHTCSLKDPAKAEGFSSSRALIFIPYTCPRVPYTPTSLSSPSFFSPMERTRSGPNHAASSQAPHPYSYRPPSP